ncbi:hypothetical protein HBI56_148040 [Parastagonospora nodorum]|nr:hypothetical protein HBH56_076810 [Parastagonospora nodorum]KAH3923403.1 hypothetical protein HBH54_211140 [Parastagonospora nodorum]KAH3951955.1 hypothetical protein HBH53_051310 [Parastagonospora nodorum]KAH3981628.1 hypothetical protein HBH51_043760 [Parastagonospora nodorum]KAH3983264.1 hypothetical protein HBH52_071290 [Parastagonospora nodorum]
MVPPTPTLGQPVENQEKTTTAASKLTDMGFLSRIHVLNTNKHNARPSNFRRPPIRSAISTNTGISKPVRSTGAQEQDATNCSGALGMQHHAIPCSGRQKWAPLGQSSGALT